MTRRMQRIEVLSDRPQLDTLAEVDGLQTIGIDLANVGSKSELLKSIGAAMGFPEYFGLNWDALEECLRDLNATNQGWRLVFEKADNLLLLPKRELTTFLSVLSDTAAFWESEGRQFRATFVGGSTLAAEVRSEVPQNPES